MAGYGCLLPTSPRLRYQPRLRIHSRRLHFYRHRGSHFRYSHRHRRQGYGQTLPRRRCCYLRYQRSCLPHRPMRKLFRQLLERLQLCSGYRYHFRRSHTHHHRDCHQHYPRFYRVRMIRDEFWLVMVFGRYSRRVEFGTQAVRFFQTLSHIGS